MNNSFVYRGKLIGFEELIGWFVYDGNGNRFDFDDKETCKEFINKILIQD